MADSILLRYAAATVPRYTSYPTAAQFSPAVGAAEQRAWLAGIAPGAPLSLYVHIPFCRSLCWYCGCHTTVPHLYERARRYLAHLHHEIETVAALLSADRPVVHCHFGGGTPTYLNADDLVALIAHLKAHFRFVKDAEIAIEIDPRTLDREMAEALATAGVTRASLGVQDFDPAVQRLINRIQPHQQVATSVDLLRGVGIAHLSFDLLYGLPGQTPDSVTRSARLAAGLRPQRLAVFGYAHVPWFKKHQRAIDESLLPDTAARLEAAQVIATTLLDSGYEAIGFDHFALPTDALAIAARNGRLHRNFQGYTDDSADILIGFGASAISSLPQGYVQNAPHLAAYAQAIGEGGLAGTRGVALDAEDHLRRAAIERLLCDFALDVEAMCRRHGFEAAALDDAFAGLAPLEADGLVRIEGRKIRVTTRGRPFVRHVAFCFDAASKAAPGRHSRAV
ncbi:MAG: oxygen-independent coproporphyrinogen III oxidase [Alphaproteobacteria bacterium]|nr:MAG: oxygen-independent coproporphyrinogen III oxidase [Alphaproteobacteria bacterium]